MRKMSEATLQENVLELAHYQGWITYHTYDSRRSGPGFPDLCMVHPRVGRLIFAELKSDTGVVTSDQKKWLEALGKTDVESFLWRPDDWRSGNIQRVLMPKQYRRGGSDATV